MPIYRYHCVACHSDKKVTLLKAGTEKVFCDECGNDMARVLSPPMARSMETADEYRDKKIVEGVDKMVDERANEHFRKHELPRMIAENGEDWARERGLIDEDGRPK